MQIDWFEQGKCLGHAYPEKADFLMVQADLEAGEEGRYFSYMQEYTLRSLQVSIHPSWVHRDYNKPLALQLRP